MFDLAISLLDFVMQESDSSRLQCPGRITSSKSGTFPAIQSSSIRFDVNSMCRAIYFEFIDDELLSEFEHNP